MREIVKTVVRIRTIKMLRGENHNEMTIQVRPGNRRRLFDIAPPEYTGQIVACEMVMGMRIVWGAHCELCGAPTNA